VLVHNGPLWTRRRGPFNTIPFAKEVAISRVRKSRVSEGKPGPEEPTSVRGGSPSYKKEEKEFASIPSVREGH